MNKRTICILLIFMIIAATLSGCTVRENDETNGGNNEIALELDNSIPLMNYDNSAVLFDNPDRGLRMETYITLGEPLYSYPLNDEDPFERAQSVIDKYREDSPTLCQVYVYLSNYTDRELDDLAFEQMKNFFELFRAKNIRILLRFAYGTESVDDAPYKIVSLHIEQLKDWFAEEKELINDTLYCLQTGVIGYWGEGHSYHNLKKRDIKKVIADIAELAPEGIYTQVRTYEMLDLVSDEDWDKVGIHDDYIVGDMYHVWSFIPKKYSAKFNKAVEHAKLTVNDGEMPWGRETVETDNGTVTLNALDGKAVLEQLAAYSITSFSLEHNYCEDGNRNSIERWKDEYLGLDELNQLGITVNPQLFMDSNDNDIKLSVYDILRYHLGYQLVLSNYAEKDGEITFSVTNYGFAAPLNFNYFALVCRNSNGESVEVEIADYDKTELQSGKSAVYSVALPENCEAVGVMLDTYKDRNVCVRFANDTEYKDGVQHFK